MTMNDNIAAAIGDPAGLERLYRNAQAEGNEASFKEALRESVAAHPGDVLLLAWVHRLDVAVAEKEEAAGDRHWLPLIGGSVVLGVMSALLAGGKPPVPAPGEASTVFWVSWGPLMALGLLAYLAWVQRATENVKRYAVAAVAVVALALYVGLVFGGRTGDAADLVAAEAEIVSHMNADHGDAVQLYATRLLARSGKGWLLTGVDPEGADLRRGGEVARLAFDQRATTAEQARVELVRLVKRARG